MLSAFKYCFWFHTMQSDAQVAPMYWFKGGES
jgi:hypothetical protein